MSDFDVERRSGNKSDGREAEELSERLRIGSLRPVYHGLATVLTLKELVRNYNNLVEDSTRVMQRIKALFRARAIPTPGVSVYRLSRRKQWLGKLQGGTRVRAASLLAELALRSSGVRPVRFAIRANMRGPISSRS